MLGVNAAMFVIEMVVGWWAESTGLIADSLDMLADALVYGIALFAVTRGEKAQVLAARVAGVCQFALAVGILAEVGRRAIFGAEPLSVAMVVTSLVALAANAYCLSLVAPRQEGGAHMRASYIFTANDVLINLGVIVAAALVWLTNTAYPDLIVGAIVGGLVLRASLRIFRSA